MTKASQEKGTTRTLQIEKVDNTFTIGISCKTVDEVAKVLANIEEPGRFIVSVHLNDIADLRSDIFNISGINLNILDLEDKVAGNSKKITETTMSKSLFIKDLSHGNLIENIFELSICFSIKTHPFNNGLLYLKISGETGVNLQANGFYSLNY